MPVITPLHPSEASPSYPFTDTTEALSTEEVLASEPGEAITATGAHRVPISFDIWGSTSALPSRERFEHDVALISDELEPSFIAISELPPEYDKDKIPYDREEIVKRSIEQAIEPSKIVPVIDGSYDMREELENYASLGIETVLVSPSDAELKGERFPSSESVISSLKLVKDTELFERVGLVLRAEPQPDPAEAQVDYSILANRMQAADFGVTTFVLQPDSYIDLIRALRERAVEKPIIPGIMPFASPLSVETMIYTSSFGVQFPEAVLKEAELAEAQFDSEGDDNPVSRLRQVAIKHTVDLAQSLVESGAPALHIYTRNDLDLTRTVVAALRSREDESPHY